MTPRRPSPVDQGRLVAASLRLWGAGERLPALLLDAARPSSAPVSFRLGRDRALLLCSPRDVEHVLVSGASAYEKPRRMTGPRMQAAAGSGVLTADAAAAAERRAVVAPLLRGESVAPHAETAGLMAAEQIDRWLDRGELDLFVELIALARRIALRTVVGRLPAREMDDLEAKLELRRAWMVGAMRRGFARRRRGVREGALEEALGALTRARRERRDGSIIAGLAERTEDDGLVVEEARTLLLSAYETAGTATAWTVLELAENPGPAAAVRRASSDEGRAGGSILGAVVAEALRLHPPIPHFHRMASSGDRLPSGVGVPVGRTVVVSPFVMGRLPSLWPDAERFRPERFQPGRVAHDKYAYIPFGAGGRVCIARSLALSQTRRIVAEICGRLDLAPLAGSGPDPGSSRRRPPCPIKGVRAP